MTDTALAPQRYLELINVDADRLVDMGERDLTASVPSCAGWDVAEVVWHTAGVFEHKVRVMADSAWPDPWPPPDFDDREELPFLRSAKDHLLTEFAKHDPSESTVTFGKDKTVGFWLRRMACEVAVHRYDAELAFDEPTPIEPDLAVDGIDEALDVMLAGPWWDDRVTTEHPVEAVVAVQSGGVRWLCDVRRSGVTVDRAATDAGAGSTPVGTISGEPQDVFLWLWGRVGDERVELSGDPQTVAEFRARLVECM
ncbi:MAG: maleylpyruvate isomerase family mycothiol-dependent enzyme [Nocardioidaceae bacterium]